MAFDFHRALSLGRRAYRLFQTVQELRGARPDSPARPPSSGRRDDARPRGGGAPGHPGETSTSSSPGPLLPDFTGRARVQYAPLPGPAAGPGEVVWTWVPYEEMDGRGKDRPVLLVGRDGDHLLGLMLTSRDRNDGVHADADYVDVGSGPWDRRGRPSEAKLDRILRVDPDGVRREGGVLDPARFEAVGDALARVQGWER